MSTFVKICGITNLDDALAAVESGVDALGFNFVPESPRFIEPQEATEIALEIPEVVQKVGVLADAAEEVVHSICQLVPLDFLQFHGDETPYYCEQFPIPYWKAFRLKDEKTLALMGKYSPAAFLVDAYQEGVLGGTGEVADWDLAKRAKDVGRVILAGGLNADNVERAIDTVKPWGVDVCSGVEVEPGKKDPALIDEFVRLAKAVT